MHRYPDRVLLKLTHICAVYCRFCFRREMVGPDKPAGLSQAALAAALDYIRSHPQIWEVILTGGDPLILSPRRLRAVMKSLAAIDHVKVVRIHTRMPVAEPARMTADLVRAIKIKGKPTYVAVHVNHPRELTAQARAACARLADAGIPLLSQTVLLAGVNDTAGVMDELMRALVECRIKPYYLHHGDLAPGTGHLRTDVAAGQELMRRLRGRASGLCQPTYVLDIPGGHGKSPIGPSYVDSVWIGWDTGRRRRLQRRAAPLSGALKSVSEGQDVEQGGRDREARKADKDDRDHGMPDEDDVAAKSLADMLILDHDHGLTLQGRAVRRTPKFNPYES